MMGNGRLQPYNCCFEPLPVRKDDHGVLGLKVVAGFGAAAEANNVGLDQWDWPVEAVKKRSILAKTTVSGWLFLLPWLFAAPVFLTCAFLALPLAESISHIYTMKSFQIVLLAFVVACASAFAPVAQNKAAFVKPLAMSNIPEPMKEARADKNAAAVAAFTTALAPFAANAADIDEGTVIGYGAGLVACVVSLAVGFAIGYGTLVKP